MIEVKNLTKAYPQRAAIQNISFSVKKGEILGFLGPNGAGKSTTMKILSGFISATSGTASINGFDVAKNPLQAKASLGYLPENPPVYGGMPVQDYLEFTALLHRVPQAKVKKAVAEAMEKCALTEVKHRLIGNLSKGFRQRVGLAQAIAHNPPVLILDEPTVGLDPKQIIDIRNLIQSLGGDHTVILSTHILPEVQATCSRVVVIDRGLVVAEDTLSGIQARMQGNLRLVVLTKQDPSQLLPRLEQIGGVSGVKAESRQANGDHMLSIACASGADPRAEVAELCVKQGLGLVGLTQESLSLEDAFVKLVTHEKEAQ